VNITKTISFAREGRGHYVEALRYMMERSGKELKIGSVYEFQCKKLLSFYSNFLPRTKPIILIPQSAWAENPPEWIILALWQTRNLDGSFTGPEGRFRIKDSMSFPSGSYHLEKGFFYSSDLSGSHWLLYRRQGPKDPN